MGAKTKISWTHTRHPDGTVTPGSTWNIVSGCTKNKKECLNCYVQRDWHRFAHLPAYAGRKFTDVACHEDRLDQPLRWQKARRIFVCSTADLCHDAVPDAFLDRAFAVMALSPIHTFLILTKRPERLLAYLAAPGRREAIARACKEFKATQPLDWEPTAPGLAGDRGGDPAENTEWLPRWPLPNVHVGVTAGSQETADEFLPVLMKIPAVVRWVSAEPLISPLNLSRWTVQTRPVELAERDLPEGTMKDGMELTGTRWERREKLDGVVCGGESGTRHTARPMLPQWAIDLKDQCENDGVAFYFKQQGVWILGIEATNEQIDNPRNYGCWINQFDGKTHDGNDAKAFRDGDINMLFVGREAAGERLQGREYRDLPC